MAYGGKIINGIDYAIHRYADRLVLDGGKNGMGAKLHCQLQAIGILAGQEFVDRLAARDLKLPHRYDLVPHPEPGFPDADTVQVLRRQAAVVSADGGIRQNDHIAGLETAGAVGMGTAAEQSKALFCLSIDVGNDSLPVQREDGMGRGLQ